MTRNQATGKHYKAKWKWQSLPDLLLPASVFFSMLSVSSLTGSQSFRIGSLRNQPLHFADEETEAQLGGMCRPQSQQGSARFLTGTRLTFGLFLCKTWQSD